jgi:hypothetical protein
MATLRFERGMDIESRLGGGSCTWGTASFQRVNRPGRGVDNPPTSSGEVKGRVELYLYSPSVPSWQVIG